MSFCLVLMASGRGSNVQAIINAIEAGQLNATIALVLCNVPDAPVIGLAKEAGIPIQCIPHHNVSRQAHEDTLLSVLDTLSYDCLVLAGYMRVLSTTFLNHVQTAPDFRVVNIHPSLLPAFPGTRAYDDAYHYGVKIAGITIHYVTDTVDSGPILAQASFERHPEDTLASFKAKGLALEHHLYPHVLENIRLGCYAPLWDETSQRYCIQVAPQEALAHVSR